MSDAAYLAFDHSSETTLTDVVNSVFTRRRIVIANDSLAMVFLVQREVHSSSSQQDDTANGITIQSSICRYTFVRISG